MNRVLSKLHKPIMNNKLYIQKKLINTDIPKHEVNKSSFIAGFILGTSIGGISGGSIGIVIGGVFVLSGLSIKKIFN